MAKARAHLRALVCFEAAMRRSLWIQDVFVSARTLFRRFMAIFSATLELLRILLQQHSEQQLLRQILRKLVARKWPKHARTRAHSCVLRPPCVVVCGCTSFA